MSLAVSRLALKQILKEQEEISREQDISVEDLKSIQDSLDQGELSIAVVGEVNRGKSTFLNALMGIPVFPSRATVCTAGVTILDNGAPPRAQILWRSGKVEDIKLDCGEPAQILSSIISRKNTSVQDIQLVKVWYPNTFTGHGILLVDTPGVNDPETWREEITYSYLADADAVILLLDPMQPLSASETEFLSEKILQRSISNLIFVVNKIDDVTVNDRQTVLERIRTLLSKYVPNPVIYAVSAKQALRAKQNGDDVTYSSSGFEMLEKGMLNFLEEGRGGILLKTKVQRGLNHLEKIEENIARRQSALDASEEDVREALSVAKMMLNSIEKRKRLLQTSLQNELTSVESDLNKVLEKQKDFLNRSLVPSLKYEADLEQLRGQVLRYQRDSIQLFRERAESLQKKLMASYGTSSAEMANEVISIFGNLDREATNAVQSIRVDRAPSGEVNRKRTAAAIGAGAGAAAGIAAASTITTTTVVAYGTASGIVYGVGTATVLGTGALIGIGALTGGIGLLLGLAAFSLMGKKDPSHKSGYVDPSKTIDNRNTSVALERFLQSLSRTVASVAGAIVTSVSESALTPLDQEIMHQKELIRRIELDLNLTKENQMELRTRLSLTNDRVVSLRNRYAQTFEWVNSGKGSWTE